MKRLVMISALLVWALSAGSATLTHSGTVEVFPQWVFPLPGTAPMPGAYVELQSGDPFVTGEAWDGDTITIDGVAYEIWFVASPVSLFISGFPPPILNGSYAVETRMVPRRNHL